MPCVKCSKWMKLHDKSMAFHTAELVHSVGSFHSTYQLNSEVVPQRDCIKVGSSTAHVLSN